MESPSVSLASVLDPLCRMILGISGVLSFSASSSNELDELDNRLVCIGLIVDGAQSGRNASSNMRSKRDDGT